MANARHYRDPYNSHAPDPSTWVELELISTTIAHDGPVSEMSVCLRFNGEQKTLRLFSAGRMPWTDPEKPDLRLPFNELDSMSRLGNIRSLSLQTRYFIVNRYFMPQPQSTSQPDPAAESPVQALPPSDPVTTYRNTSTTSDVTADQMRQAVNEAVRAIDSRAFDAAHMSRPSPPHPPVLVSVEARYPVADRPHYTLGFVYGERTTSVELIHDVSAGVMYDSRVTVIHFDADEILDACRNPDKLLPGPTLARIAQIYFRPMNRNGDVTPYNDPRAWSANRPQSRAASASDGQNSYGRGDSERQYAAIMAAIEADRLISRPNVIRILGVDPGDPGDPGEYRAITNPSPGVSFQAAADEPAPAVHINPLEHLASRRKRPVMRLTDDA